jgi:periplasmic protein CpxP/Spy
MTTYTRTLSTIAAGAVAVTIAVAAAAAGQAGTAGPRQGPGRGGPGGHFPLLRQLNLTDAQRQQIKALVDERRAAGDSQSPLRTLTELQRSLAAALFADTPDTARIDELKAGIAEAEAAALAARVDLQLKIAQILTPEQRKQARELRERGPRLGRRQGARGLDFHGNR